MKLLDEIAKKFNTTKPIFRVKIEDDGSLRFYPKEKFSLSAADFEDPVDKLLTYYLSEHFKDGKFVVHLESSGAYRELIENILTHYERESPLRNPTQSRLYKWVISVRADHDHPAGEGFIKLYRYMHSMPSSTFIAILELMREKYENEKNSN